MSRVCVIGLGKLGACAAAVFADAGHSVIGVDLDRNTVDKINGSIAPVDEPGLQELIDNNPELTATTDISQAVQESDVAFVIVPTPSLRDGSFDSTYVEAAVQQIGSALTMAQDYLVVIASTVMPGTCAQLQHHLDRYAGRHVPLIYSPEFIALGSVIDNMRHPDFVLIGTDDGTAAPEFIEIMRSVVGPDVLWAYLRLIEAELAKIAINSYVTMKISFANQLASICEGLPGANAQHIAYAIGHDRRIGNSYLNVGGPFGGPCFPRDNRAFQQVATLAGTQAPLADATDVVNDAVVRRISRMIPMGTVAILGLTYKTGTPVQEESLGSRLSDLFDGAAWVHDPTVCENGAQSIVDKCQYVVIATPWPEYTELDYSNNDVVVDVWGILPPARNVIRPGVNP